MTGFHPTPGSTLSPTIAVGPHHYMYGSELLALCWTTYFSNISGQEEALEAPSSFWMGWNIVQVAYRWKARDNRISEVHNTFESCFILQDGGFHAKPMYARITRATFKLSC